MIVPGSNTLNLALSIMGKASFQYMAYTGRTSTEVGMYDDSYASPVPVTGSAQPTQRSLYDQLGLDFQKNYHTFYLPQLVGDVARGRAGDKFTFNNQTWQAVSTMPWFAMDGWTECVCIEIPGENTNYISPAGFDYGTEDGTQNYIQE